MQYADVVSRLKDGTMRYSSFYDSIKFHIINMLCHISAIYVSIRISFSVYVRYPSRVIRRLCPYVLVVIRIFCE